MILKTNTVVIYDIKAFNPVPKSLSVSFVSMLVGGVINGLMKSQCFEVGSIIVAVSS